MTAPNTVQDYHSKATTYFRFMGNPEAERREFRKLYFGVELEVTPTEKWLSAQFGRNQNSFWQHIFPVCKDWAIATHDGSIGDYGFELKTAPMLYNTAKENFSKLFAFIEDNKEAFAAYGEGCGIHVHVSKAGFTPLQLSRLNMFINSSATRKFIEFIGEREHNNYCNYKSDQRISDFRKECKHTDALNIGVQTVEFRLFKGTTLADNFFKNLEFVHAAIRFVHPDLCSDYRSVEGFKSFVSVNRDEYPNLYTFITEGELIEKREARLAAKAIREAKRKVEQAEKDRLERVAKRMQLRYGYSMR